MSSLKLFRSTEFALSSFYSPQRERAALHPVWALVLTSVWIATACNLALWKQLAQVPELDNAAGVWFDVGLGLMIAAASTALLSLLSWRWLLKPAITVFLLAAAVGTYFMLADGVFIDTPTMVNALHADAKAVSLLTDWRLLASVLVLAVLPAVGLWRASLRRLHFARQLFVNASTFIVSCLVLAGAFVVFYPELVSATRHHAQLRYLVNPLNSIYALADIVAHPVAQDHAIVLAPGKTGDAGPLHQNGQSTPPNP